MKVIFDSLGSNYTFSFAIYSLSRLFVANPRSVGLLKTKLEKMFTGKAFTFYKGRDAIEFSFRALSIGKQDVVLTQAFTCKAVEEGIKRSGTKPFFVDIEKDSLNLSVKTLEDAYAKNKSVKAVLVQHTLGYPADIISIRNWCDEKGLILIEDLAHSIGGRDDYGKKLGSEADVVILSFGRDKMVDAVSGGACVIKTRKKSLKLKDISLKENIPLGVLVKDLMYPINTWVIRNTYSTGFGKLYHHILKKLGVFSSAIESPTHTIGKLPTSLASMALRKLANLEKDTSHRQSIASFYEKNLPKQNLFPISKSKNASFLRFPILVKNPNEFIYCMKRAGIHIANRWYKDPVDCGSLKKDTSYKKGSCPIAEGVSNQIINLPTHRGVSIGDAKRIVKEIKSCLK